MIQTGLEFESLGFEICLEFGFCYLGFLQLRFGITKLYNQFSNPTL